MLQYINFQYRMMTSSNGKIFRVTSLCAGNSPSPVNSPHKGKWRGALMLSFICAWINGWANNREAGDLRRNRAHYDVTLMPSYCAGSMPVFRAVAAMSACGYYCGRWLSGSCRNSPSLKRSTLRCTFVKLLKCAQKRYTNLAALRS